MLKITEQDLKVMASHRFQVNNIKGMVKVTICTMVSLAGFALMTEGVARLSMIWLIVTLIGGAGAALFLWRYYSQMKAYEDEVVNTARRSGCQAVIDGVPIQPVKEPGYKLQK